ncbi:sugar ABC transporter substrate-binding protein [Paenibacillus sp. FSL H8-0548]|uniref:substrate-binding domain-containing protein n=1 Tax=Paenibacillus sp. FSL H8-0548 TaxID=1920422 RepID=UPI00096D6164|nr:substrate-binding domain-containing protein [Paenibacillus sp. FSL H8-0548]OMF29813.1 sugar ABC transporter substrate-binding protein [Paenibacillus sp. FSL H8-0548]
MRKTIIVSLFAGCLVILFFTLTSMIKVFSSELIEPALTVEQHNTYRLVLITRELDTPFWAKVEQGAMAAAESYGVSLEVWGTYGTNRDDFLKNIEIAIASKVDGIIVQGLDTDEFKSLTKVKAASGGIPIITVANDVPMNESLRRTYVGSDHLEAGSMIARQLVSDMGFVGKVVLMVSDRQEHFQRSRLTGILNVLNPYKDIETIIVAAGESRVDVAGATTKLLNEVPDADAFIAVSANHAGSIIQEIGKRMQVDPFFIYSFDDSPETLTLMQQGKIDALIAQSPSAMGEKSVAYMIKWLTGELVPLNPDGYFTDIRVLRAEDVR